MIRGTRAVVDLLAGKWSVDVLYLLASGTRRYSEVFYEVGEISKKTLTQTLRALERDGLIARRVHAEVPPKVEYSLTPLGWSLTGTADGDVRVGGRAPARRGRGAPAARGRASRRPACWPRPEPRGRAPTRPWLSGEKPSASCGAGEAPVA